METRLVLTTSWPNLGRYGGGILSWKIQNSWRVHVVWTIFHLEMWKPGLNVGDFVGRIAWILGTITKWNTPIRQTVWDFFGCIYFHQWGLSVKLQLRNLWKISNISSCWCKKSCTMVIFSISNGWFSSLISERNQFLGKPRVSHLCATSQAQAGERTVREVLDTVPRSQWRDGSFGPKDSHRGFHL